MHYIQDELIGIMYQPVEKRAGLLEGRGWTHNDEKYRYELLYKGVDEPVAWITDEAVFYRVKQGAGSCD